MPTVLKYDYGVKLYRTEDRMSLIADPVTVSVAKKSTASFITHGHTDHAIAFPNAGTKVYSTQIAKELFSVLTSKEAKNTSFVKLKETLKVNDIEVKFIPAGHLLGAAQLIFYCKDKTILYTGDLCTEGMLTTPPAEVPDEDIDVIITESTYGDPNFFFEPREKTKTTLLKWIAAKLKNKVTPVINIGHLGPTQEIIAFLNQMTATDVYCNDKTCKLNEIYQKNGVRLKYKNFESEDIESLNPNNSIILLSRGAKKIPNFLHNHTIARSIITGQSVRFAYSKFEQAFPFSMHSNSKEILNFIKQIQPKKVFTMYGFDAALAAHIRQKLKIQARPLKFANKKISLDEFF